MLLLSAVVVFLAGFSLGVGMTAAQIDRLPADDDPEPDYWAGWEDE